MKYFILLMALSLCINKKLYSMEYWCPPLNQPINKQEILHHSLNEYWKQLAELDDQNLKDSKLKDALEIYEDPFEEEGVTYDFTKRPSIICALAAGANPDVTSNENYTAFNFAQLKQDRHLADFAIECGGHINKRTAELLLCERMFNESNQDVELKN